MCRQSECAAVPNFRSVRQKVREYRLNRQRKVPAIRQILSQLHLSSIVRLHLKSIVNLSFRFLFGLPNCLFQNSRLIRATCPAHSRLTYFSALTALGHLHRSQSSSLCNYPKSFIDPIFLTPTTNHFVFFFR